MKAEFDPVKTGRNLLPRNGVFLQHRWDSLKPMHGASNDEAASALDVANEAKLYRQLLETGATLISVGHRSTILKFHTQVLELAGDGDWQVPRPPATASTTERRG
jgi:hypothetical protein